MATTKDTESNTTGEKEMMPKRMIMVLKPNELINSTLINPFSRLKSIKFVEQVGHLLFLRPFILLSIYIF